MDNKTNKIIVVGHDITEEFKSKVITHIQQQYGNNVEIVFATDEEISKHTKLEKEQPVQLNELTLPIIPFKILPITPFIDFEQFKRKRINEHPNRAFTHKYRKK